MVCLKCEGLGDDSVRFGAHVIRTCSDCSREYAIAEPGAHGIGIKIEAGDRFVLPSGFIKIAANPLKFSGQLSRSGLAWFAELVFQIDLAAKKNRENVFDTMLKIRDANEALFKDATFLEGLSLDDPAHQEQIAAQFKSHEKSAEWWGYIAAASAHEAAAAVARKDAEAAALWAACAERYRALALFKTHFEEVVFMGHSASRLVQLLRVWDLHRKNDQEGFWQQTLREHSFAFSQLFSVPVAFIGDSAYVGGTQIDGKDARFVDFMFSGGAANHAILIEIKTPTTKLLGRRYRGGYSPSPDLGGSIVQINDYCHTLRNSIDHVMKERSDALATFNPRRVVLIGDYREELKDARKRSSFEHFRTGLAGVEVVTFDEFFQKVEELAKFFNLVRTASNNQRETPAPPA